MTQRTQRRWRKAPYSLHSGLLSFLFSRLKNSKSIRYTTSADKTFDVSRHVNAEFGKGSNNPTFAYTFSSESGVIGGLNYMGDAVRNLIIKANLDTIASAKAGAPVFNNGYTEAEGLAAVVSTWQSLYDYRCPPAGQDINNANDPNAPP